MEQQVDAGTRGEGDGGSLRVDASESVRVIDGILTVQADFGTGNAGDFEHYH